MLPEQEAFIERLYRKYYRQLMIYATSVLKDNQRAQDIVQDTFHEGILHIDTLTAHVCPQGWLLVTLRNKIRESERSRRRFLARFLSLDTDVPTWRIPSARQDADLQHLDCGFALEMIERTLTPDEYRLLKRLVMDGASHLEVSKEFGITVYASQKRLERIRTKLRNVFKEQE